MQTHSESARPLVENSILCLVGPTAVGKSEVALLLAERLNGEIISVDSMQVYQGLDIGTAKPSKADRARIPHHLIDVVDINTCFDAAQFVRLSRASVAEIRARGHLPILCGGTGLYFKAFIEGLGNVPPGDAELRDQLKGAPLPELLRELANRDPVTYERIDRSNPRRVVRALEVIRLTGKPFSSQQAKWLIPANKGLASATDASNPGVAIGLARNSADLANRINLRVDEMFRRGLVAETGQLLKQGLAQNRTALQALGYRQVSEYLQGLRSLSDTVELVKCRTRQYAKRQMTWFRRQISVRWLQVSTNDAPALIAEHVQQLGSWA